MRCDTLKRLQALALSSQSADQMKCIGEMIGLPDSERSHIFKLTDILVRKGTEDVACAAMLSLRRLIANYDEEVWASAACWGSGRRATVCRLVGILLLDALLDRNWRKYSLRCREMVGDGKRRFVETLRHCYVLRRLLKKRGQRSLKRLISVSERETSTRSTPPARGTASWSDEESLRRLYQLVKAYDMLGELSVLARQICNVAMQPSKLKGGED